MAEQQTSWQLRMFKKTLKKQLRLRMLKRFLGPLDDRQQCLLVTCGDNNGAMNWHLREIGGKWTWADVEDKSIVEMSDLLGEPVHHVAEDRLPFDDGHFDICVTIDVHEHLQDPDPFTAELVRVTRDDGRVLVTVPGGERRLANMLKEALGMTKDEYGHARDGYSIDALQQIMSDADLQPRRAGSFSRFFTELVELALNYVYVKKMAKKSKAKVDQGVIAPATKQQLDSVKKAYRVYSCVFPFVWLFSKLDLLLFFTRGYVVLVEGRKRA